VDRDSDDDGKPAQSVTLHLLPTSGAFFVCPETTTQDTQNRRHMSKTSIATITTATTATKAINKKTKSIIRSINSTVSKMEFDRDKFPSGLIRAKIALDVAKHFVDGYFINLNDEDDIEF
jgi:hypothetical protein